MNGPHLCRDSLQPFAHGFEPGSVWRCPECETLWRLTIRSGRRTWTRAGWWTRATNRHTHVRLYPASTRPSEDQMTTMTTTPADRRVEALRIAATLAAAEGIAYLGSPVDFTLATAARFVDFLEGRAQPGEPESTT